MNTTWTYEYTIPLLLLWIGFAVGVVWSVYGFARHLPKTAAGVAILCLRLAFLALLFWVMLLPGVRRSTVEKLRPRFLVLLDTSASMQQNHDPTSAESRWQKGQEFLKMGWTKIVRARCQVEVYPFAAELGVPLTIEQAAELTAEGGATHLNASLTRLFERSRGQELAGVLVLSDGVDTRERHHAWADGPWPAPIFVAELEVPEEVEELPDVRVEAVDTQRRAIVDWDTTLTATIAGNGVRGESFAVELLRDDKPVERAQVQLPPEGGSRDLQFTLAHPVVGTEVWRVRIPPLLREAQTNDNELAVAVTVLDAQNRVLFLENTPRFESKHVSRELFANRNITPLAYFRGPGGVFIAYGDRPGSLLEVSAEQLAENKIVILGNFDAEAFDAAKSEVILEFVEKGGSLILLGGDRLWGAEGIGITPLNKLLPFSRAATAAQEGRYGVQWTAEGRAHPAFANAAEVPEELPPVLTVFAGARPNAAALTLVEAEVDGATAPLILSRVYGQGKVLAILTDSLWRWAMQPGEDKPYSFFWRQIIEWMSPSAEETGQYHIELFCDTAVMAVGEMAMLQARLIEPPDATPRQWRVTCDVATPTGRVIPLHFASRLIPGPGGRDTQGYVAELMPDEPGNWRAVASVEVDGRRLESSPCFFTARAVSQEKAERPANLNVLRSLGRGGGGRYAPPPELDAILRDLQVREKQERRMEYNSLWQNRWLLALLIALLGVEWVTRKLNNMQ
ncbi:MAG: hypothetical protein GX230_04045 [Lentisphaerae bacterium]|jgi:hypothetical protein|nr:hypothetical protein [Lentisphaerota bacterium]